MALRDIQHSDLEYLNLALDAGGIGIWECDHQTQIIRWSSAVAQMVGLQVDKLEITYADFFQLVHPEDLELVQSALLRAFETHQDFLVEYRVIWPDGTERWIEDRGRVVVPDDGSPPTLLRGVVVDIESRKKTERAKSINAELRRVSRFSALGEITAGMAHELNQPLMAIVSTAEMLMNSKLEDGESKSSAIKLMCESAFRASDIVAKLRNLVRKAQPTRTLVCINELISDTRELVEYAIEQNDVKLEFELDRTIPQLELDAIQIHQVLVNLINNSIIAMRETRNDRRRIRIATQRLNEKIRVSVKDSGVGLKNVSLLNLFEPFGRNCSEGLGIGLPICKSIIESHDGTIWADSNVESGAEFHFELPMDVEGQ